MYQIALGEEYHGMLRELESVYDLVDDVEEERRRRDLSPVPQFRNFDAFGLVPWQREALGALVARRQAQDELGVDDWRLGHAGFYFEPCLLEMDSNASAWFAEMVSAAMRAHGFGDALVGAAHVDGNGDLRPFLVIGPQGCETVSPREIAEEPMAIIRSMGRVAPGSGCDEMARNFLGEARP